MVKTKLNFQYQIDGSLDLNAWLDHLKQRHGLNNTDTLQKAVQFTHALTQGLTTFYGKPRLELGLEVAEIILQLKLDQETAAASILSSALQLTPELQESIQKNLSEPIAKLIKGVQQIEMVANSEPSRNTAQLDKMRKMLLAIATDIRVVIIKLAERLCVMRGIKAIPLHERNQYAQVVMDIYAPLANRLGIGQLKWELEDIAFHYLNPIAYKTIAHFLAERRTDRETHIQNLMKQLQEKLRAQSITAEMMGRAKHIYSIYLKSKRKHMDYESVYDCSAIRVLVPTIEDCYTVLGIVNSLWPPLMDEFDDYIAHPKPNGYRSIHTAVIGDDGKHFEIQIRTHHMHEEAERGVAAHWIYKENKAHPRDENAKMAYLRQLLDWHREMAEPHSTSDATEHLLNDQVYVSTPAGDILDLTQGATPIDAAYHIHTELGHRCRGAKINGQIVPLTYQLKTGDKIEIITSPQGHPSRDWLNKEAGYVKTTRTRSKILHWFKQQTVNEVPTQHPVTKPTRTRPIHPQPIQKPIYQNQSALIAGAADLLTRLAKCCKPIPNDAIIGYITYGRGISIHKKTCNNIKHLPNSKRFIEVDWEQKNGTLFHTDLHIFCQDQNDLLNDITALLANEKITLLNFKSTLHKNQDKLTILATIQIQHIEQLQKLLHRIQQLPGVIDVMRVK